MIFTHSKYQSRITLIESILSSSMIQLSPTTLTANQESWAVNRVYAQTEIYAIFTPSVNWRMRLDNTSFSMLAQISNLGHAIFATLSPTIQTKISQ